MAEKRRTITAEGRTELAWPGKGNFEPRPALALVEREVFATDDGQDPTTNLIVGGDARDALPALLGRYEGQVQQVYIDPPFSTGEIFGPDYDDRYEHALWLNEMLETFDLLYRFLKPEGSFWLHLDENEVHYAKLLCDGIFGRPNFIGEIIWQKKYTQSNDAGFLSINHDTILIYAKDKSKVRLSGLPRSEKQDRAYRNPDKDPEGPWKATPLHAKSGTDDKFEHTFTNGVRWSPPQGTFPRFTHDRLDEFEATGAIWFGRDGRAIPSRKTYLKNLGEGVVPKSLWTYKEVGHNHEAKDEIKATFPDRAAFSTPKPERLMRRIVTIGSKPGDLVLDCFAGSGTTAAVAHKLGRNFVTIERSERTATEWAAERIRRAMLGTDWEAADDRHNADKCDITECPECQRPIKHVAPKVADDDEPTGEAPVKGYPGGFTALHVGEPIARRDPDLGLPLLSERYRQSADLARLFVNYSGFELLDDHRANQLGLEPGLFHAIKERRLIHFADDVVNSEYVDGLADRMPLGHTLVIYARRAQSELHIPENVLVEKTPRDFLDDLRLRPADASWVPPSFPDGIDTDDEDDESSASTPETSAAGT